jgi:hypothetical protein
LRRIEQQAGEQAARRAGDSENLHGLLKRVASIERILAVTELRRTMARARVDLFSTLGRRAGLWHAAKEQPVSFSWSTMPSAAGQCRHQPL